MYRSVNYFIGGNEQGLHAGGSAIVGYGSFAGSPNNLIATEKPLTTNNFIHTPTKLYKNNIEATYNLSYTINDLTIPRIGSRTDTSAFYYIGDIYEIIIYNRVLTDLERAQLNNYLVAKWGIT